MKKLFVTFLPVFLILCLPTSSHAGVLLLAHDAPHYHPWVSIRDIGGAMAGLAILTVNTPGMEVLGAVILTLDADGSLSQDALVSELSLQFPEIDSTETMKELAALIQRTYENQGSMKSNFIRVPTPETLNILSRLSMDPEIQSKIANRLN